jgi:hypothetical protein
MKLDLLTNATVVDDAIRFVSSNKSIDKIRSFSSNEDDKEESNKPDYDEDENHLEEEQVKETGKMTIKSSFLISIIQRYFNYNHEILVPALTIDLELYTL